MKVIFYYRFLGLGGVETSLLNRIAALQNIDIEAEFWFSEFYGKGARYIASLNRVQQVNTNSPEFFKSLKKCDVIVIVDNPSLVRKLEKKRVAIPVIYETHASFPPALKSFYSVVDYPSVRAVVVPSEFNKKALVKSKSRAIEPVVINNCIDFARFKTGFTDCAHPLFSDRQGPVVLWIGRLEDEKNLREMIRVAHELAAIRQDISFVVIGDSPGNELYLDKLESSLNNGFPGSVFFINNIPLEEMPCIYNLAANSGGLLLSTSLYESAPMTFIEAMACGCPVVSTDVGGVKELIDDGNTGFLYTQGDIKTAANLVDEITDKTKTEQREAVIRTANDYVMNNHSMDVVAQQYKALLEELVSLYQADDKQTQNEIWFMRKLRKIIRRF